MFETYRMPVLDTIYVRKSMRRQGFAEQLVNDFIGMHADNDIGINDPISGNMFKGRVCTSRSRNLSKGEGHMTCKTCGRTRRPSFFD